MIISWLKNLVKFFLGFCLGISLPCAADPGCQNAHVIGPKLITDICWQCLFPIRLAGITISGPGGRAPEDAAKTLRSLIPIAYFRRFHLAKFTLLGIKRRI